MFRLPIVMMLAGVAFAQQQKVSAWEELSQLSQHQEVEVRATGPARIRGALVSVSTDAIVVALNGRQVATARNSVREIRVRRGWSRGRRALAGAGIGAGAGFGIGAAVLESVGSGLGSEDAGAWAFGFTVVGSGIGAAIGALIPNKWRTVYLAPGVVR